MPDQNNPTDTSASPAPINPPPVSDVAPPPMDIPVSDASMPPPFPPEVAPPEGATPPPDSGSAAPSFDIPPVITPSQPKKKFGGKRVIATILGLLVLVGGLGAGVILVRQQQDIREKAATPKPCKVCSASGVCVNQTPPCLPDLNQCELSSDCPKPTATPRPPTPTPGPKLCGYCSGETCVKCGPNDNSVGDCASDSDCKSQPPTPSPPPSTRCTLTASEICVGNNPIGECYQGGDGEAYACYKLQGNPGKKISGSTNCDCPAPYTWGPRQEYGSWWCFNTAITSCTPGIVDGTDTSERCSLLPQQCAPTSTPPPLTPPPTKPPPTGSPPPTAQCLNIQAFDTSWNKLSSTDLSNLKPGDKVRFTVAGQASSGNFDKARFIVNNVQRPEVTGKRPGTDEFYDEYTIAGGITRFTINAQIHHEILGWSMGIR